MTHAAALTDIAVRVACWTSDPFRPGVEALARLLPPGAELLIRRGCHSGSFFQSQLPASIAFLGGQL